MLVESRLSPDCLLETMLSHCVAHGIVAQPWKQCCLTVLHSTLETVLSHCVAHGIGTMLCHCVAHGIVTQPWEQCNLHMALLLNCGNNEHCLLH